MDKSGNLYGTTDLGGASGDGTVFELPSVAQPSFEISGFPASTTAGTSQAFTITALNADGTTNTSYAGTVHFTSNDPKAVLPADYTFTTADAGVHTFSASSVHGGHAIHRRRRHSELARHGKCYNHCDTSGCQHPGHHRPIECDRRRCIQHHGQRV